MKFDSKIAKHVERKKGVKHVCISYSCKSFCNIKVGKNVGYKCGFHVYKAILSVKDCG